MRVWKAVCVTRKGGVIGYLNTVSPSNLYAEALDEGVIYNTQMIPAKNDTAQGTPPLSSHRGDTIASSLLTRSFDTLEQGQGYRKSRV